MSGTEIVFLLGLAIVVVGPKRLPTMMRTAGQWVAKIRRMTSDVRQNTGIDKIIRDEGLEKEIRELSSLTRSPMFRSMMNLSPGALVANALAQTAPTPQAPSGVTSPLANAPSVAAKTPTIAAGAPSVPSAAANLIKPAEGNVSRGSDQAFAALKSAGFFSFREREYPTIGCDAYDALPDDLDDPDAYPPEMPEGQPVDQSAALTTVSPEDAKPVDAPTVVSPDVEAKPLNDAPTDVSTDLDAKPSVDAPKEPEAAPKVENATTETNVETSATDAKVETSASDAKVEATP